MFIKQGRLILSYTPLAVFGILVFSIFAVSFGPAFAETVAESTSFEKTTLIEFTNNESVQVQTVRMWLGKDAGQFKSFKTEKGWTGTKTPLGVLVFSTDKPLDPGESVKFGIKTEIQEPSINWRTIDSAGNDLTTGKTTPGQQPSTPPPPTQDSTPKVTTMNGASFKIIPESPKNGDSVRIVGSGFPPNLSLDFLIDNERLEDFVTDEDGNLLGRTKIPLTKESDRVEFSLVDDQGNKKTVSIRISHADTVMSPHEIKSLSVTQFSGIVEPGKKASASGTAKPSSAVTITAKDASGNKIYEAVVTADTNGNWSHETTVPPDAEIGTRTIEFSDGIDTVTKILSVSPSTTLRISSSAIRYEPGQKMLFSGNTTSSEPIEVVINDPIGKEIFSDIIQVNNTSTINFEYATTATSLQGTYVILLTQGKDTDILLVGLGELPSEQVFAKFEKLNYSSSEKATLEIQGPADAKVSVLVIDPSDKAKLSDTVTLGLDGSAEYELDLNGYKSGVYTVVVKYLKSEVQIVFSVGLQQGAGEITIQATKQTYQLGEGILVLGSTSSPNVLLTLTMYDPDGNAIKRKDTFSDKEGKFSESTFRIPSDAKQGIWKIKATSGPKFKEVELQVAGTVEKAFVVNVDKTTAYQPGQVIVITGTGSGKTQTVIITITDANNAKIQELTMSSTKDGSFQTIWTIPTGTQPGQYKISSKVGNQVAETKFNVQ